MRTLMCTLHKSSKLWSGIFPGKLIDKKPSLGNVDKVMKFQNSFQKFELSYPLTLIMTNDNKTRDQPL